MLCRIFFSRETISWLSKEASQRYFVMTGLRPMLNLSTKEGASLSPEDAVDVVVSSGEEVTSLTEVHGKNTDLCIFLIILNVFKQVVGTLQSWDLAPLAERYHEACESLKTGNNVKKMIQIPTSTRSLSTFSSTCSRTVR